MAVISSSGISKQSISSSLISINIAAGRNPRRTALFLCSFVVLSLCFSAVWANEKNKPVSASAIFAGGCFWCMEPPFDKLDGVLSTTSGYTGGAAATANYKAVSAGNSGHVEVIKVDYDPQKISYQTLLQTFWLNIDPYDHQGQFCDKGKQYLSYIYFSDEQEKTLAEQSLQEIQMRLTEKNNDNQAAEKIATKIIPATEFYPAEDYHQNYYQRNPIRYRYYRNACGRDRRLKEIWGNN